MKCIDRLGLGSVQWGMSYGIANFCGQPSSLMISQILATAADAGVSLIDTAASYGDAESKLGEVCVSRKFRVVTKTTLDSFGELSIDGVKAGFFRSMNRLKCKKIYGLLVHDAGHLLKGEFSCELWNILSELKDDGYVEKIGVSVYTPEQLERISDNFPIEIVQLPYSVYDQRFAISGSFDRLKRAGVEVHVRSAFLQGLILMSVDALPKHFSSMRTNHALFIEFCNEMNLSPVQVALGFCLSSVGVDRVIVGFETQDQFKSILKAAANVKEDLCDLMTKFRIDDENIILPINWPRY